MQLTDEQKDIVASIKDLSNHLVINAYAGTGKTTTLCAIAEAYPDKTFLYLAFNASVKREAEKRFPPNVKVYTTHGLAYKWYMLNYGKPNLGYGLRPYDINIDYALNDYKTASLVKHILHEYWNSVDLTIDDTWARLKRFYHDKKDIDIPRALGCARQILEDMEYKKRPITHDFYLKLAMLNKDKLESLFRQFDFILLDEAQDTNPVVFEILLASNKPIIAVGDVHQKIYGFRNAIDVMSILYENHHANRMFLTHSFRFSQNIADIAYKIIQFKEEKFGFEEFPPIKGLGPKKTVKGTAILCRTNAGIVRCIHLYYIEGNKSFTTFKPPSEIFALPFAIADAFYGIKPPFKLPQHVKFVYAFRDLDDLEKYAKETDDIEVLYSIKLVRMYYQDLYNLYTFLQSANRVKKKESIILTAHTAKGLEFETVYIFDDWPEDDKIQKDIEEVNLAYVSCTRASKYLFVTSPTLFNNLFKTEIPPLSFRITTESLM